MNINQTESMRILVTIAEEGGFSAAARKLRVQQSSVSRIVSALEDHLGVALLTRTTRKLSFTEAGLGYLAESRRILTQIENLNASTRQTRDVPQGTLRISIPAAFGKWVLLPLLGEFKQIYPAVNLEINIDDRLVDLVAESYDLVVRVGEVQDSRITSKKIAVVRRGIFVSRKLMKVLGPIHKPTDLEKYPAIAFDDRLDPNLTWTLNQGKIKKHVHFKSVTSVNQLDAVQRLACDGLGVAKLPLFMGIKASGQDIEHVLPDWDWSGDIRNLDSVFALFIGGKKMSAKVRVFLDYLSKKIGRVDGML